MINVFKCKICNKELDKYYDDIYACNCEYNSIYTCLIRMDMLGKNVSDKILKYFAFDKTNSLFNCDLLFIYNNLVLIANYDEKKIYSFDGRNLDWSNIVLDKFIYEEDIEYNFTISILENLNESMSLRKFIDNISDNMIFE